LVAGLGKLDQVDNIGLNVDRLAGREAAKKAMDGRDALKSSVKDGELAVWVKGAVDRMDALLPDEKSNEVMESCGRSCIEANKRVLESGLTGSDVCRFEVRL